MTDPTEELLTRLRPSAPSAEMMARLRAAKPAQGFRCRGAGHVLTWRRAAWFGGLAAAAAWVFVSQWTALRKDGMAAGSAADATGVAQSAPPRSSQIFLPVESTRTLVSLQPARVVQQPDEPPQRFLRVVWVDDVTAVGAETDAALHLRRSHEAYLPVSSPVY